MILRARIVDQKNLYKMLYVLHMVEQQFFTVRLGPSNVLNQVLVPLSPVSLYQVQRGNEW